MNVLHMQVKKVVWDESTSQWNVSGTNRRNGDAEEDQNFGDFDALIVADALTAIPDSAGYIGLLDLETHKAQGVGEIARQMSKLKHQPVFTLMVSFPNALLIDYDAAFVLGSEAPFQWLARDSSKPGRCSKDNVRDNWTAITSYQYARQLLQRWPLHVQGSYNPQTSSYREAIAKELVAEFVKFLNFGSMPNASSQLILEEGALYKAQRWGRAFLTTPLSQDFLASDKEMFIACGDFCGGSESGNATTIPPSPLENAWRSGRRAAEHLATLLG
jgi:predicted NAD/FAD-dependent oxidoreductase